MHIKTHSATELKNRYNGKDFVTYTIDPGNLVMTRYPNDDGHVGMAIAVIPKTFVDLVVVLWPQ